MAKENWIAENYKVLLGTAVIAAIAGGFVYQNMKASDSKPQESSPKPKKKNKKKKKSTTQSPSETAPNEMNNEIIITDPKVKAQELKTVGNQLYSQKKFEEAIELYTQAIGLFPNSVYFCNRAACYSNLGKHDQTISDCNEAIRMDPKYIKAFQRRALAHEALGSVHDALNDYTVVCALENFKNQNSMAAPDRLLKKIAADRTGEIMKSKQFAMPSETFISAYLDSFRARPTDAQTVSELATDSLGDQELKAAFLSSQKKKWLDALNHAEKAIESDAFSSAKLKAIAYNFRATFYFLMGKVDEAVEDFEICANIDDGNINTIIKRATLFVERGEVEKTIDHFNNAEALAPKNVDLYYHRGQVRFLTGDFNGAVEDYMKSLEVEKPEESSVYCHIQLGVAKYKLGDIVGAEKKFRETKKLFPDSAEVWNYHGEILLDKQSHDEAERSFDKAIAMDPQAPLPYVNKAILVMQWKQDVKEAERLCRKSIVVDPLCDIAYTHLAQLLCLANRLDEAIQIYDEAIKIARTEADVMNIVSCQEAALAQMHVIKTFPEVLPTLQ